MGINNIKIIGCFCLSRIGNIGIVSVIWGNIILTDDISYLG